MINSMIDITQVTSSALKNQAYSDSFPEYYALATVTENSLWHDHQTVLDHVISVFAGLEQVLLFKDLPAEATKQLQRYLSVKVESKTKLDLLKIATLLHDIAKVDTLINLPNGIASCPGHELIGAGRVKLFAERFGLETKDKLRVENIVRYHGLTAQILDLTIANQDKEKYWRMFKDTVGDIALELILLMQADLLGSDLQKSDQNAFNARIEILSWMLTQVSP